SLTKRRQHPPPNMLLLWDSSSQLDTNSEHHLGEVRNRQGDWFTFLSLTLDLQALFQLRQWKGRIRNLVESPNSPTTRIVDYSCRHLLRTQRIAIEKLREVVNEMLWHTDCSELSWNEDSNDEIIYSDNVTVHATDARNISEHARRFKRVSNG
ncbi:hypothetical protein L9F63_025481, partial [Diploptera punctata]